LCPVCNKLTLVRKHRTFLERLRYASVNECPECQTRLVQTHAARFPALSLIARCPQCGTTELRLRKCLDYYDPLYHNPISLVQKYLGGAVLYCVDCRLQFYDLRPRRRPKNDE
jgi:ribosomal protein L32